MAASLSRRQAQCLELIRESIANNGYSPTLRELGSKMGISSTNGVNDHLRALERKGYIARRDWLSRAITLCGEAKEPYIVQDNTERWRPIANAPLDGTWLLLWTTERQWVLGCWDEDDECWATDTSNSDVGVVTHFRLLPQGPRQITEL